MTKLSERPHSLIENFGKLKSLLATRGPASLQSMREIAFDKFEFVGLPTIKDEEFKYVSMRALEEGKFAPAYGATIDRREFETTRLGNIDAITVAFVNGEFAPELSSAACAAGRGVFVGTLEDGFLAHEATILEHLGKHATLAGKLGSTNDERSCPPEHGVPWRRRFHLRAERRGVGQSQFTWLHLEPRRPWAVRGLSLGF